jgi:hypothetical protein
MEVGILRFSTTSLPLQLPEGERAGEVVSEGTKRLEFSKFTFEISTSFLLIFKAYWLRDAPTV